MTWAMTTDGLLQEARTRAVPSPYSPPQNTDVSRVPQAFWAEEPCWDDRRVIVVDPAGMRALGTAAAMEGYLWISVEPPRPCHRGKLALHIEECIESALQARGAQSPGVGASTSLDASLGDQLYRARLLEFRGIALGVPSLAGIVNLGGVVEAEDSAVLRWWVAAAMDRPVRVVLSSENRNFRIYPSPVPFGAVLDGLKSTFVDPPTPRPASAETAQSVAAMELSDLPPGVTLDAEPLSAGVELPELDRALGLDDGESDDDVEVAVALPPAAVTEPELDSDSVEASAEELQTDSEVVRGSSEATASEAAQASAEATASEAAQASAEESEPQTDCGVASAETSKTEADSAVVLRSDDAAEASKLEAIEEQRVAEEPPSQEPQDARLDELTTEPSSEPSREEASSAEASVEQSPAVSESEDEGASAMVAALGSPAAPAVREIEAPRQPSRLPVRPIIKSLLSAEFPRKNTTRVPFIQAADDVDEEIPEETASEVRAAADAAPAASPVAETVAEERAEKLSALAAIGAEASSEEEQSTDETATGAPSESAKTEAAAEEDPFDAYARQHWQSWVKELDGARGPRPLAFIERLFVTVYTRLDAAVQRGIGDDSARQAIEQWRNSFSKSYTEAFDALRLRGKRPSMVLDVPELAQRMGRLHGARRVQLLLVDGLRFDLGMMVQERIKAQADATLAERMLLWSALPTTTTNQLELIGKGADGLRELVSSDESPAVVARGRAAHTLRRVRTGRRELFKLDIVEAALREESPGNVRQRMPGIADAVAECISEHFTKQSPRTLVVVFGDHGFRFNEGGAGLEITQGGASPEEVLVPAFAWLTGAVH